jgi:hypothetical protein
MGSYPIQFVKWVILRHADKIQQYLNAIHMGSFIQNHQ